MEINSNQLKFLRKELYNKKLLIFGPGNINVDKNYIKKLFDKYDFIIINNGMLNLLENVINIKDYKIIHVTNGQYTGNFKDTIIRTQDDIFFYWVSEIHTFREFEKYEVNINKVMHMANNYKNFGFSGCPTMGPKMLMFILFYKLEFKSLKITGLTFYMDFDTISKIYNTNYHDIEYYMRKYESDPDYPELSYLKDKTVEELTEEDKIKLINVEISLDFQKSKRGKSAHGNIYEGWNMFLRFITAYNNNEIKLDKKLLNLLKKYPTILNKDPS